MKPIDVFENLVVPLKAKLENGSWEFLMQRGEIFISQCVLINPIKNLNYALALKVKEIAKDHIGMNIEYFRELPEVKNIYIAMDVIKPYIEKD